MPFYDAFYESIKLDSENNPQHRNYIQQVIEQKKLLEVPASHSPVQTSNISGFETCKWIQLYYEKWSTIASRMPYRMRLY